MIVTVAEITINSKQIEVDDTPYNRRQISNASALIPSILADKREHDSIIERLKVTK